MNVIELHNVTKTYGRGGFFHKQKRHTVLDNISLDLREGECLGLVGRSGSGKSTLGRIMLGLESPDSGTVRIMETDLAGRTNLPREVRRAVQVVFQDAIGSCNPRLTAGEIIAEPLRNFERLSGAALRDRIAVLLQQVGLSADDATKLPGRFSGGQLQRICIARALAPKPRVIVLDEAVSSLDMLVQARMLDLLEELRHRHGTAYLFVTHDLRLVRRFCDRAFIMNTGALHAFDPNNFSIAQAQGMAPDTKDQPTPTPQVSVIRELSEAILPPMPR